MTAYVFGTFLLAFTGLGAMVYNINAAVSNFEYVLDFCCSIFVVLVPILTMRVIAEERKQKTDQLLYSLPITTTQVILGKYLALLVVFLIPLLPICYSPLVFAKYGDVYLLTAYGAIFAFFLLGAALIALGIFISSLTENQAFAAGISAAVILFNYFSVSLSEYVSTSAYTSLVALVILSILLTLVIKWMTQNDYVAYGIGLVLVIGFCVTYFLNPDALSDLLPTMMTKLSLFQQFETFVNGIFDLTAVVYFLSVIAFFLFLSVQSLEKRRYN
jgi:ABC-2 type transport system permease protein